MAPPAHATGLPFSFGATLASLPAGGSTERRSRVPLVHRSSSSLRNQGSGRKGGTVCTLFQLEFLKVSGGGNWGHSAFSKGPRIRKRDSGLLPGGARPRCWAEWFKSAIPGKKVRAQGPWRCRDQETRSPRAGCGLLGQQEIQEPGENPQVQVEIRARRRTVREGSLLRTCSDTPGDARSTTGHALMPAPF